MYFNLLVVHIVCVCTPTQRGHIYALEIMHKIIGAFLTLPLNFQYQNKKKTILVLKMVRKI